VPRPVLPKPVLQPVVRVLVARVRAMHADRFVLEHGVFSRRLGRLAAVGDGLIVPYDYSTLKRAPMPAEWTAAVAALDGTAMTPV